MQRSPFILGKARSRQHRQINIRGRGYVFFQTIGGFVDHLEYQAFRGESCAFYPCFSLYRVHDRFQIGLLGVVVYIEADTVLGAKPVGLMHLRQDLSRLHAGPEGIIKNGRNLGADVQSQHVEEGKGAHGHPKGTQGLVHLLGGSGTFLQSVSRLV